MTYAQIYKLYASHFLTGLVFWYAIENVFQISIGLGAVGIGINIAFLTLFNVVFDIPSGVIADHWSRKYMLVIAAGALAVASIIYGSSSSLLVYLIGTLFYGVYFVAASGTFQAIIYDSLAELGREHEYSKIMGRAYALFLVGAGVGNIASGFIASSTTYQMAFYLTALSCIGNIIVMLLLREPSRHKQASDKNFVKHALQSGRIVFGTPLNRAIVVILALLMIIAVLLNDFGQLYISHYLNNLKMLGLLWALYAFSLAFGSFIAHYFAGRLWIALLMSSLPIVGMFLIDHPYTIGLIFVQAIGENIVVNRLETYIQSHAPSQVRATILSVISAFGRLIVIPTSIIMGWVISQGNIRDALWITVCAASAIILLGAAVHRFIATVRRTTGTTI